MNSPIFFLIYISIATELMTESELLIMLEQSSVNNKNLDLSGMLLYMEARFIVKLEGRFIQLLEGDEEKVRLIYERIKLDERNHQVILLETGYSDERKFSNWSMGFETFSANMHQNVNGFFNLNDEILENEALQPFNRALSRLKSFYQINKTS